MNKERVVLDKVIAPFVNQLEDPIPCFSPEQWDFIKGLAGFLTTHGVKIYGTYRHFKGDKYIVTGIVRDAEDWNGEVCVEYMNVGDATHKASRKLSDFLGIVDKPGVYTGPRFTLEK